MKRTTIKSLLICLGLALVLLGTLYGLLLGASASAQGGDMPHEFYGAVEIDGAPAAVDTVVRARGGGVDSNLITVTEVGLYGGPHPVLDKRLIIQDLADGTPIAFYVNDVRARCRQVDPETGEYIGDWRDTYPFQAEMITELDLAATGEYTLTVSSAGCCPISVTYGTVSATVTADETQTFTTITGGLTVTLEAVTGVYCDFGGWGGALVTTTNPVTITMTSDKIITATCFDLSEYTLTVHTVGSGAVTREPSQTVYIHGTVVTLTATPSETVAFGGWSGAVESSEETVAITMDSDKEITATFDFYSVTVSPPVDEGAGDPGEWVYYYTLQVTNTGDVADIYTATAVSGHAWSVVPPTVGAMGAGETGGVVVRVQVPLDVISGTVDVVTFTVTSQGDPRKSATALLMTTATGGIPANRIFMPLIVRTGETH